MFNRYFLMISLALMIFGIIGCGTPNVPNPSDPVKSRDILRSVLESWKRGETFEDYQKRKPTVTVVEPAWKSGLTMTDYDMSGEPTPDGYDVQFKAKLIMRDKSGVFSTQKAVYNVSTTPAEVVVRAAQ